MRRENLCSILIFFLLSLSRLCAEEPLSLPDEAGSGADAASTRTNLPAALAPEAPSSFISFEREKLNIDFILKGRWSADLRSSPRWALSSSGLAFSFGGSPFLFSQHPSLLLRLQLQKAWFFEANLVEEIDQTRLAAGYHSEEGALKEARVGNFGLSFPSYPFLDLGSSGLHSPGMSARFAWGQEGRASGAEARAFLRLDSLKLQKASYIGLTEVREESLPCANFIQGRFFILPEEDIQDLQVYVRDNAGLFSDGLFSYSALEASAYVFSAARGRLDFKLPLKERSIVSYRRRDGAPIASNLSLNGEPALLLFDPGILLDTHILSRYDPSALILPGALTEFEIDLGDTGSASLFGTSYDPQSTILEVYRADILDPRAALARMPFYAQEPGIYEGEGRAASAAMRRILLRSLLKRERIEIDSRALPESIRVRRNGAPETAFSYSPGSGYLEFTQAIQPSDRLEIEYLTSGSSSRQQDFSTGFSMDFLLSQESRAYIALGGAWALPWSPVSQPEGLVPGKVGLSSGFSYESKLARAGLDIGLSYLRDDANDICRLDGMEEFLVTQEVTADSWKRSALPQGLSEDGRAPLIYRDYAKTDVFGNSILLGLDSGYLPPAVDGNLKQGPYIVSDSLFPKAAAAEFSLGPDRSWSGIQIQLDQSLVSALPQAQSIIIPLRYRSLSGALPELDIVLGLLPPSPDDSTSWERLPDTRYRASVNFPSLDPQDRWLEYELPLPAGLAATLAQGAHLALVFSSTLESSGIACVGSLRLRGAAYLSESALPGLLIEQSYQDGPEIVFPQEIGQLRSGEEGNASLKMSVSGNSPPQRISLGKYFPVLPLESYARLSLFMRSDASASPGASVRLCFSEGTTELICAQIPLSALEGGWRMVSLDFDTGQLSIASAQGIEQSLPFQALFVSAPRGAIFQIQIDGLENGSLSLDELALQDSRSRFQLSMRAGAGLKKTGILASYRGIPLISNLEAKLGLESKLGENFEYAGNAAAAIYLFPLSLSARLSLSGHLDLNSPAILPAYTGAHGIALPFGIGKAETLFSLSSEGDFSQSQALILGSGEEYRAELKAQAEQKGDSLSQKWLLAARAALGGRSLGLSSDWSNKLSRASPLLNLAYPQAWLESYRSIAPQSLETSLKRSASISVGIFADRAQDRATSDVLLAASSIFQAGLEAQRDDAFSVSISPLLLLGKDGLYRLRPSYRRSLLYKGQSDSPGFTADIAAWAGNTQRLSQFYLAWPFVELFTLEALSQLQALENEPYKASLEAATGLAFEREALWGLADIFIPRTLSYNLRRHSEREGSVLSQSLIHTAGLDFQAIDLFGRRGLYPRLAFASSDEYGLKQSLEISQAITGSLPSYAYALSASALFLLQDDDSLTILDDLRAASSGELFSNELSLQLSKKRAAAAFWNNLREELLVWLKRPSEDSALVLSSDILEGWGKKRLYSQLKSGVGFVSQLSETGGFGLRLPLSVESSLVAEEAFKLKAGAKLDFGLLWSEAGDSQSLGFEFSIGADFEF